MAFEIVYFDLETSDFRKTCDVLQIAATCNNKTFNKYIRPTQPVAEQASEVNGMTNINGRLHLHGRPVPTSSLYSVLRNFLEFLEQFERPCILVAHNCPFDYGRLITIIQKTHYMSRFEEVIDSFVDTLELFKKKFPYKNGKGAFKLTTLAREHGLSIDGAHNALNDIYLLEDLVSRNFNYQTLVNARKSFSYILETQIKRRSFEPLEGEVSNLMILKMVRAGLNYDELMEAYEDGGEDELIWLLKDNSIGSNRVIQDIVDHFEREC